MGFRRPYLPPPPDEAEGFYFKPAFRKYFRSEYHHSPTSITIEDIKNFLNILYEGKNLTIARYNDGEWAFGLNIGFAENRASEKHKGSEHLVFNTAKRLIQIINSHPEYHISIDSYSLITPNFKDHVEPYLKQVNQIGSGIFNVWSMYTGFKDLFEIFNQRKTLVVGPQELENLPFNTDYITTHPTQEIYYPDKTISKIKTYLKKNYQPNMVILYSCGFTSKIAIDYFYNIYKNDITQLDMGASLNPFVGFSNRPWHKYIIKQIESEKFLNTE